MTEPPGAVVIGGHVNGLGLLRALAARGVRTAVVATKPYDFAHRSRWAESGGAALDLDERPDALAELLERRAGEWRGRLLLPANDGALVALARHRDRLASAYRIAAPPWEVVRTFIEKPRSVALAEAIGVAVPRGYGPATPAVLGRADLRFPLLVKPDVGHAFFSRFGVKLFAARDRAALASAIARLAEAGLNGHVVDWIPGGDGEIYSYCTWLDRRGEPSPGVTVRKVRQSPPLFGVARVARVAPEEPDMREATVEIARRAGLRGVASCEFKRDPRDGRFRFLETNARSVIYNSLLARAGLDVAWLTWCEHARGAIEPVRPRPWPGAWIHLHADVLYAALRRREDPVSLADFIAPYRGERLFAVWSRRDPGPFLAQWAATAGDGASLLWRRLLRTGSHSPPLAPAAAGARGRRELDEGSLLRKASSA